MDRTADTEETRQGVSITLAHDHGELTRLNAWSEALARELALSPRTAFRLDLALTEAVTNVIDYGRAGVDDRPIQVTAAVRPDRLHVTISDAGPPFDPLQVPDRAKPDTLEEMPVGGLGIDLYRQFTDECAYAYRHGRNELTLTFLRSVKT